LDGIHFVNAAWVARPRRALLRVYRAALVAAVRGRMGRMPAALVPVAAEITWSAPVIARERT
jgi:rhamnosyltransferase